MLCTGLAGVIDPSAGSLQASDALETDLAPGAQIAGRYRLEEQLGRGGMGVVWAATSEGGDRVAIKFMRGADGDPRLRRRFLREARAAAAIQHPNVVRVLEVLELADGAPAIVMERLDGESLARRVVDGPPLTVAEAASVLLPTVSAVGAAHALGIVHRDLKPENIFLTREADGSRGVKVLDFGIAKLTASGEEALQTVGATTTGALLGTPSYMSPEQVFGEKDIDHRTDVWSIGMLLYECVSGLLPTQAENVGQILKLILTREDWHFDEAAPDAPDDVKDLVRRMLLRDPKQRPELHEVAAVLGKLAEVEVPDFGEPAAPRALGETPSESGRRSDRSKLAFASTVLHDSGSASARDLEQPTGLAVGAPPRWRRVAAPLGLVAAIVLAGLWWLQSRPSELPMESSALASAPAPTMIETAAAASLATVASPASATERPALPEIPRGAPVPRKSAPAAKLAVAPSAKPSAAPAPPPAPAPAPASSSGSLTGAIQPKPPF